MSRCTLFIICSAAYAVGSFWPLFYTDLFLTKSEVTKQFLYMMKALGRRGRTCLPISRYLHELKDEVKVNLSDLLQENPQGETEMEWSLSTATPPLHWKHTKASNQVQHWSLWVVQLLVSSSDDSEAKYREWYKQSWPQSKHCWTDPSLTHSLSEPFPSHSPNSWKLQALL